MWTAALVAVCKLVARNVSHIEPNWRQNPSNFIKSPSKICQNGALERFWEGLRSKLAAISIPGMLFAIPGMLFVGPIGATWPTLGAIWDQTGRQWSAKASFLAPGYPKIEKLRSKERSQKHIEILINV